MNLFFSVLCILCGIVVIFNSIFKLKRANFKEKFHFLGAGDGSVESSIFEILFSMVTFFPWWIAKGFVINWKRHTRMDHIFKTTSNP
ncbi:hypothetical protein [Bacillus sp. AFS031507]|uniref:hypothetical protein n=1 Tax=Bacillus sp. AFS031507 TaxID=2033496 RepID=UPI000BFCA1E3|nr:hypothetical protein [Bacillus sp. AFS031507]PGY06308.1 hypothetical protein COE25_28205 [Bacillus sp. AFS031507]